jgi:two-component system, NtrC family, nitrogen regulation response regulator NtrX
MSQANILIVDDEPNILKTLSRALTLEGYTVDLAESGEATLARLGDHQYDVIMLDVKMTPGVSGIDALKEIRHRSPDQLVVMMSGHSTIETAVQATRLGAYDFLEKPLSIEKILLTLENALKFKQLQDENVSLRHQMDQDFLMIGRSPIMKKLWDKIEKTAPTSGRAFILGENGTGKELVARLLHQKSKRQDKPFIKLNCAAVPTELIESELFGHEKGSFTGAFASRKGKFELAHRGTLFLDEIGDMKLEMQSKLLRVLQEGELERVGGSETIRIDVRVIAATNKDIQHEIQLGNFREDLYYRLNVVPFVVPPLRERLEDIPLLAEHFLKIAQRENAKKGIELLPDAVEALQRYQWPGNVRELKNIIERLVILSSGLEISAGDVESVLPPAHTPRTPAAGSVAVAAALDESSLRDSVADYERQLILRRLRDHGWRISQTARVLGLERSHLYKKMKQYGIQKPTLDDVG